jgi:hypothetical protein
MKDCLPERQVKGLRASPQAGFRKLNLHLEHFCSAFKKSFNQNPAD